MGVSISRIAHGSAPLKPAVQASVVAPHDTFIATRANGIKQALRSHPFIVGAMSMLTLVAMRANTALKALTKGAFKVPWKQA